MISNNLSITNTQWPSPMGLQPTPPSSTSAVGSEVNQLLNATTQLTTSMQDTVLQNKQAQKAREAQEAQKRALQQQQATLLATLPPPASINTTDQAPVAKADPPLNIGDSIARGIEGVQGNGLDTDPQQVGRTPQGVLQYLIGKGPAYFNGKTVQLSSGILNAPNALATVEEGLKFLKEAGAKVRLVGVPENNSKFASLNNQLEKLAKVYGATWLGGYKAGSDGVHPSSYASLKTQFADSSAPATTPPTAPPPAFTPGSAVAPTPQASAQAMPRSASMPASENPNTVKQIGDWVKSVWTQSQQLIANTAPAQAATIPTNAVAMNSGYPAMPTSNASGGSGTGSFIHPLGGKGTLTSPFGMRNHPVHGGQKMHKGQDLAAAQGTPILSVAEGTVTVNSSDPSGYGNWIEIKHDNGKSTRYGHMKDKSPLAVGVKVTQGQVIGAVGSTGSSTGPHLHFEVRDTQGQAEDPIAYLPGKSKKA